MRIVTFCIEDMKMQSVTAKRINRIGFTI
jgi:hypothetical protein